MKQSADIYAAGYDKFRFGGYGEILANFMDYGINRFRGTDSGSTAPAAGLYLTEGKSHKALVDVVADKSEKGLKLVEPGSAEESFLHIILHENILKYDHTNIITTSGTLTLLDDWINNGAKE